MPFNPDAAIRRVADGYPQEDEDLDIMCQTIGRHINADWEKPEFTDTPLCDALMYNDILSWE